jgi:hypothetical protein
MNDGIEPVLLHITSDNAEPIFWEILPHNEWLGIFMACVMHQNRLFITCFHWVCFNFRYLFRSIRDIHKKVI